MLLALLERIGNRTLQLDPDTMRRLGNMEGKVICVQVGDGRETPLAVYVLPSAGGVHITRSHTGKVDVTIRGTPALFLRLFARQTNVVSGDLQISGDIELGQRFKRLLDSIDIDWEEHAARVVGDVAAHQLGNAARGVQSFAKHARHTLALNVAEYLQEESRTLMPRARIAKFLHAVDTLRADADRLEQRVERLRGVR